MSDGRLTVREVRQKTFSDDRGITDSVFNPGDAPTTVGAPAPTDFLPIDEPAAATSTTLAPAPSDFLPIDEPSVTPIAPPAPPPSQFLPIDTVTSPQPAPATSAFIPINPLPVTTTTSSIPSANFLTLNPATTTPAYVPPYYCGTQSPLYLGVYHPLSVANISLPIETVQLQLALQPLRTFYRWIIRIPLQLL